MKRLISLLAVLVVGLLIGWYLGYNRPIVKNQRTLLNQYEFVRTNFHLTDEQMAELGQKLPDYFKDVRRQDELAAAVALGAFQYLERGDADESKRRLLRTVGSYYRVYLRDGGDTNLISQIEEAAKVYPALAAELAREVK